MYGDDEGAKSHAIFKPIIKCSMVIYKVMDELNEICYKGRTTKCEESRKGDSLLGLILKLGRDVTNGLCYFLFIS